MNNIKISSFLILLFSFLVLSVFPTKAQDFIFLDEDFEKEENLSWSITRGKIKEGISYIGNKSLEVFSSGEAYCIIDLPENTDEIVVRGWMKVKKTNVVQENKGMEPPINLEDTLTLSTVNLYPKVSFSVEVYSEKNPSGRQTIPGGEIGFLNKASEWIGFETELKVPAGIRKIRIFCENTLNNSIAYFDEISVEKRQTGFVKSESVWAKQVRVFNEKASRLVKNGDFEEGAQVWNPYWGFELSDVAHSGKYSCMIQNPDSGAWRGTGNDLPFKIPPGTVKLKVSVWIKAENVVGGPNAWETGAILLSLLDDNGNIVPGGNPVARTVGTHDWKKFEAYFPVSERATKFKFAMSLGASTGKIYFDDILAEPMTEEEYYLANLKLKNPGFEGLLTGWPAYAGVVVNEQAHSGEYSLKVSGNKPAWEMRSQTLTVMRDKKEITVGAWMKTVNVSETPNEWEGARVYIEFKDENGLALGNETLGRAIGSTDWTQFLKTIKIPQDAVEMTISLGRANVSGEIYFDDVSVEYPN